MVYVVFGLEFGMWLPLERPMIVMTTSRDCSDFHPQNEIETGERCSQLTSANRNESGPICLSTDSGVLNLKWT